MNALRAVYRDKKALYPDKFGPVQLADEDADD